MAAPKNPKRTGRPPGTATRKTRVIADRAMREGETPLEFFLRKMRAPDPVKIEGESPESFALRCRRHEDIQMEAAKNAAPYIHPRLQATEVKLPEDVNVNVRLDPVDLAKRIAFIFGEAAAKL